MASKWAYLRGKLEKFMGDQSYVGKIDEAKKMLRVASDGCQPVEPTDTHCPHGNTLLPMSKLQLCQEYTDLDREKDELEAKVKDLNLALEATNQLLLAQMEDAEEESFRNGFGLYFIQDEPYPQVEDKRAYLGWIRSKGMDDLLSVPWQSTKNQVKDLLEKGGDAPPGIKVFLKSVVRRRD